MAYNYFALMTFIANLGLAFFIFLKNPKREINQILGIFAFVISIWTFILFIVKFFTEERWIVLLAKINFINMTFCPYLVLHFVEIFPNNSIKNKRYLIYYLIPIPILLICIVSPYFIVSGKVINKQLILERGFLHKIWSLYFVSYLIIAVYKLFSKYRSSQGLLRLQIKYVLLGFVVMILGSSVTNILLPLLKINWFVHYGPLFTLPFVGLMTYSIAKYRLLDIYIFVKKSLVYFILVSFVISVYILFIFFSQTFFAKSHISVSFFITFISAVFIAITFEPLKNKIDILTDKIFFKGKYDYYQTLKSLVHSLSSIIKMDELLSKVVNTISSAMRLTYTAIFILERYSNKFVVKKQSNSSEFKLLDIQLDNPLLKYILRYKKILVCDEIDYVIEGELSKEVKNGFNELKAQVVIPIILKDKVIGLLVLGYKKSGDIFNQQDLDLLEMISSQISIILENTNLYEQIQNTSKLALIGSMAAGMAHEIRNPLSSIKMFVQMLPEKYFDKDFIQKFNEVVLEEINRLSKLVDDMLTLSKPKPPNLKLVEINSIIIRARRLVEKQAEEKGIKIVEKYNKIPQIKADESQLIQVFVNVFLNGIQSMSKGGILSIESNSNTNGGLSKYVTVAISDTGDGISKDDLDRIFEPFFTTRKEGTGLGLSICLKIIEEHNGFIKVVSKKNKGTTFTIFLPK